MNLLPPITFDQLPDANKVNLLLRYCATLSERLDMLTEQTKEFEKRKCREIEILKAEVKHGQIELKRTLAENDRLFQAQKEQVSSSRKMRNLCGIFCKHHGLSIELGRFIGFAMAGNKPTDFFKDRSTA